MAAFAGDAEHGAVRIEAAAVVPRRARWRGSRCRRRWLRDCPGPPAGPRLPRLPESGSSRPARPRKGKPQLPEPTRRRERDRRQAAQPGPEHRVHRHRLRLPARRPEPRPAAPVLGLIVRLDPGAVRPEDLPRQHLLREPPPAGPLVHRSRRPRHRMFHLARRDVRMTGPAGLRPDSGGGVRERRAGRRHTVPRPAAGGSLPQPQRTANRSNPEARRREDRGKEGGNDGTIPADAPGNEKTRRLLAEPTGPLLMRKTLWGQKVSRAENPMVRPFR